MKTKEYLNHLKNDYQGIDVSQNKILQSWEALLPNLEERQPVKVFPWRYAFASLLLLLFVSGSFVYAKAQKAKPGEPLYEIKQLTQKANIAIGGNRVLPTASPSSQGIEDSVTSAVETPKPETNEREDKQATESGNREVETKEESKQETNIRRTTERDNSENKSEAKESNFQEPQNLKSIEENIKKQRNNILQELKKRFSERRNFKDSNESDK